MIMVYVTEMETFFQQLIYGPGMFFYIALFVGFLFLLSFKIKYFSLFAIGLSVYQAINYLHQGDITLLSFPIIALFTSTALFGWRLSTDMRR